jgi:hypothetical protein
LTGGAARTALRTYRTEPGTASAENARAYNAEWRVWITDNETATPAEIEAYARRLFEKYMKRQEAK